MCLLNLLAICKYFQTFDFDATILEQRCVRLTCRQSVNISKHLILDVRCLDYCPTMKLHRRLSKTNLTLSCICFATLFLYRAYIYIYINIYALLGRVWLAANARRKSPRHKYNICQNNQTLPPHIVKKVWHTP